ncbi:MAG: threonine ammonia-lyase [Pseudomonadota bacterium]
MTVSVQDIDAARTRIRAHVRLTPLERSETLSRLTGADVWLKFENLQFTSSFKERGALNSLLRLGAAERERGVIAMSAGNHAQAVAYHGERLGVPVTIVMPESTPNAKIAATAVFGAEVLLRGRRFDETRSFTEVLAAERDLVLLHPFDDASVIAGQGTLGLELLEQLERFDDLLVPVGGGGLLAGVSLAVRAARPATRIVGVQSEHFSAVASAFGTGGTAQAGADTIAEGIAVKTPGERTLPILQANVDEMHTVSEAAIERAVFTLLEVEKTVTEGAGAVGLAALFSAPERFVGRRVVIVLSGGNIDMMVLSSLLQRGLVNSERFTRVSVEIPDLPGALGKLTQAVGAAGCNIVELNHQRAFGVSSARRTRIELALQLRGAGQLPEALASLREAGYEPQVVNSDNVGQS